MKLPLHIIELLESKAKHGIRLPSDCEYLSLDIESKTGVRVGATTLKRLLGFAADERTPHATTLDAIARYLGYAHWDELAKIEDKGNSGFDAPDEEIRSVDLPAEAVVEIAYLPDRIVRLRYLGDNHYRVEESINSKLLVSDELEILNFVLHHPLLVVNVWRDGKSIGPFTAGRVSGLQSLKVF